jgi:LPS-assembly lipoprotein
MLWFKQKPLLAAVALGCVLSLGACGFQPMHGKNSAGAQISQEYRNIAIANIPDRDGQYLRNMLIDRLYLAGRPADARYDLQILGLNKEITNALIRKDATYTRALMKITANLKLVDRETGKAVLERKLQASGSYNLLDNQFATLISRDNLTENLLRELSDTVVTSLNLHFTRTAEGR